MSLGWGESSGFDALLFLVAGDAVEFALPFGEELAEECVADSPGVEGVVGVVVASCLVSCEEQEEFGEFVGGCFFCE